MRRFLIRGSLRIEITHCFWCGDRDFVCSACVAKADAAVVKQQQQSHPEEKTREQ